MLGVDFSKTFAPVARLDVIRMLLALDSQLGGRYTSFMWNQLSKMATFKKKYL